VSIWTVLRIAIRRWFVTLPVIVIGGLIAAVTPANAAASYPAEAQVIIQGPVFANVRASATTKGTGSTVTPESPLIHNFDSTLALTAADLALFETSTVSRTAVREAKLEPTYTISQDPTRRSVLVIDVETASPTKSLRTLQYVAERIQSDIAKRSQNVAHSPTQQVTMETVVSPELLNLKRSSVVRKNVTIALLALATALTLATFTDGAIRRARIRSARHRHMDRSS
jgi:uncharacterized protein involved in exopolysaccharide biosynthesis